MGKMGTRKLDIDEERLEAVEARLAGTLRRVSARREFVRRLRSRMRFPARAEIAVRLRDWRRLVVVFGGVISGAVVVLTVARALYHLVGRRNMG